MIRPVNRRRRLDIKVTVTPSMSDLRRVVRSGPVLSLRLASWVAACCLVTFVVHLFTGVGANVLPVLGVLALVIRIFAPARRAGKLPPVARLPRTVTFTDDSVRVETELSLAEHRWLAVTDVRRVDGCWEVYVGGLLIAMVPESELTQIENAALSEFVAGRGLLHASGRMAG